MTLSEGDTVGTPSGEQVDVTDLAKLTVELNGAGGGDGVASGQEQDNGTGGAGGFIKAEIELPGIDTLEVFTGEAGAGNTAGDGLYAGGAPGTDAGGGGGATGIRDGSGTELIAADAGGGGGAGWDTDTSTFSSGGGGGARGGSGGEAFDAVNNDDGEDADGSGAGGDGGDTNRLGFPTSPNADDGGDGGTEVLDSRVTATSQTTGGGNDGDGTVTVTDIVETITRSDAATVTADDETERTATADETDAFDLSPDG